MSRAKCVVCETPGANRDQVGHQVRYDCLRCGAFILTGTAENDLEGYLNQVPPRRSAMSCALRRMQRPGNAHLEQIKSHELESFWRDEIRTTPPQMYDDLIVLIGDKQTSPSSWLEISIPELAATLGMPVTKEGDAATWSWLCSHTKGRDEYDYNDVQGGRISLRLKMNGWSKYSNLKQHKTDSRVAFMAMKFEQSDVDQAVKQCFRPAVERAGFSLRILNEEQPAGLIDDQLRSALLAARFVISDLSHGSFGAYWEAGFGEGRGIPVIYTCEKSKWETNKTHFDTNHMATIIWDLGDLRKAQEAMVAMIRATLRSEAKQTDE